MMQQAITGSQARGSQVFDEAYYCKGCGPLLYERSEPWLGNYRGIAEQLIRSLSPRTVLDAGCALGMVVEAFWDRGVEAKGIDISDFAIANVRPDMAEHCAVGSLADPIAGRFDLVTCIEVLEHMPADAAAAAVGNIAAVTDTILFTSSPYDFTEVTHVNVRPPISWIRLFGQHGMWPDLVYDASFVVPHAMLLRRGYQPSDAALVAYTERLRFQHLLAEARRERDAVKSELHESQSRQHATQSRFEDIIREQNAGLADAIVTRESEVAHLQEQCRLAEAKLRAERATAKTATARLSTTTARLSATTARLSAIERSTTWRATGVLRRMLGRLPGPVRRLVSRGGKAGPTLARPVQKTGGAPVRPTGESKPPAGTGPEAEVRTTADVLDAALNRSKPLPIFAISRGLRPRVTMVTDGIAAGSFFGGVGTATILAAQWAQRRGASLRIATLRSEPVRDNVANLLGAVGVTPPNDVEFRFVGLVGARKPLDVSSEDMFLTTSWWSTANTLGEIPVERIVYILQEDERMFYPAGDDQLRAEELMRAPGLRRVINSQLLHGHLTQTGIGGLDTHGTWFEPAFPESVYFPDQTPREKMNLFFYARPNNVRNLYERGLQVLEAAVLRGVLKPDEWTVHFVGKDLQPTTLPGGLAVNISNNLSWDRYASLVRSMDLGLSLMMTPHPSYPPLDLAACGAVAVTNTYANKTSLAGYSENIICTAPDLDALVQGLEQGISLARDTARRRANHARAGLSRSWDASFAPVLDWLERV